MYLPLFFLHFLCLFPSFVCLHSPSLMVCNSTMSMTSFCHDTRQYSPLFPVATSKHYTHTHTRLYLCIDLDTFGSWIQGDMTSKRKTPQDGWISVVYWSCWPQTRAIWQKVFKSDYITDRQKSRVWLRIPWLRSILQSIKVITGLVIWFGTLKVWHENRTSMLIGINMCLEWLLMIRSHFPALYASKHPCHSVRHQLTTLTLASQGQLQKLFYFSSQSMPRRSRGYHSVGIWPVRCAQTTDHPNDCREMVAIPSLKQTNLAFNIGIQVEPGKPSLHHIHTLCSL